MKENKGYVEWLPEKLPPPPLLLLRPRIVLLELTVAQVALLCHNGRVSVVAETCEPVSAGPACIYQSARRPGKKRFQISPRDPYLPFFQNGFGDISDDFSFPFSLWTSLENSLTSGNFKNLNVFLRAQSLKGMKESIRKDRGCSAEEQMPKNEHQNLDI